MDIPGKAWKSARRTAHVTLPLLFGGLLGLALFYYAAVDFEAGEDAARVDWLPPSASRVCWYKSYLNTVIEFDIPEGDFLAWARSKEGRENFLLGEIEPIGATDWERRAMLRYTYHLTQEKRRKASLPPLPPEDLRIMRLPKSDATGKIDWTVNERGYPRYDFREGVQVEYYPAAGWKYDMDYKNGGCVYLSYDADKGRAFYRSSPR